VDRPSESKAGAEDPKLLKACQDFEAVFLTMIWKEMQKSANVDLGGWGAFAEQAMGENWAKSGGIGLAKVMYKSMSKTLPTVK
jgi:flagellar protein FlgJ